MASIQFDHEKLDVYRVSLQFTAWAHRLSKELRGIDRSTRDQLVRASQSIPLNIAEGNGKRPSADRRRFLQIAYGSSLECAAILDVLHVCGTIPVQRTDEGKVLLNRIVAMLVKMIMVQPVVHEDAGDYALAIE